MPAPTIPILPTAPQRSAGSADLSANADAFVAALEPWGAALDDFGDWADALAITPPLAFDAGFAAVTTGTTSAGWVGSYTATIAATGGTFSSGFFAPSASGFYLVGATVIPGSPVAGAGIMTVIISTSATGTVWARKSTYVEGIGDVKTGAMHLMGVAWIGSGQQVGVQILEKKVAAFYVATGSTFWARRIA